jgi:medium-chain acyl-[acyl-carrier-protein] hydrolase
MPSDTWVGYPAPRPGATLRLFCLPYAGGGTRIFQSWSDRLPGVVEVASVRLPGRERRFHEPPLRRMDTLLSRLAEGVGPHLDRRYALFGHSVGARIAFELARTLRRHGAAPPVVLFVSGSHAPQAPRVPPTHDLPDKELIEWLRKLGGTLPEVLDNPALLSVLLPVLRADLSVADSYVYTPEPPLDCPIRGFRGAHDTGVPLELAAAWQAQTHSGFALRTLPGGHFFLHTQQRALLDAIAADLDHLVAGAAAQRPSHFTDPGDDLDVPARVPGDLVGPAASGD